MSLVLHELLLCCRGLENDKATERKKEVERFRRLIRSPETVEELDRFSANRSSNSRQLTWDAVFRFLQRYLQKETESLQSGKANVSSYTQASRQKKMQEISSLVKYFIRCANKRGPRLKCAELLSHVVEVLRGSFTCSAYGEDYSSILLKDILSIRKYWCEITQSQWDASPQLGVCLQTEGLTNTLFSFFSKTLQEKHLTVLEHLLSALNIFLRTSAMNCRIRVCWLGEELLPSILYIWAQMRPSPVLKDEIVEFFSLQLRVHHPKGAKTEDTGAHAEDWTKWKNLMYNLYDVLVGEISQIGSRGKYVTGSRHIAVKENLIELTADICHQLFSQDTQVLEVTQAHLKVTQRESVQGTPSKRRRVELGWEVLRDHLQPSQSDFDIIPWLQITSVLASKYPSLLPEEELVPLLSSLCQLLLEQRRGERGPYVLRCLKEVARCQALHSKHAQAPEIRRLWGRIWALAARGVGSHQTEALSLDLLRTIIQGGLISVDREFWKLFTGTAFKPSSNAALCLAQALLKCRLPKSGNPGLGYVATAEGCGPPSLKESIIGWLLTKDQSEDMEESSKPHLIVLCVKRDNVVLRTHTLVALEQFDTHVLHGLQSQSPPAECLVRCCVLLTGVLGGYMCTGLLTEDEAYRSLLFQKAKVGSSVPPYIGQCLGRPCHANPAAVGPAVSRPLASPCRTGVRSALAEELLAEMDLALLAVLRFLAQCASAEFAHGLLFGPPDVRRQLLLLVDQMDPNKPLHLNMVGKFFPTAYLGCLFVMDHRDLCSLYRQDQEICAAILLGLIPSIRNLSRAQGQAGEMQHVHGTLLKVISGFCILGRSGKCTAPVRVTLVHCLVALLEADPCCMWAVLTLRDEEMPVSAVLPSHLADSNHHVRMLTAMTVDRLFLEVAADSPGSKKMLPLKMQQTAFENVYLRAQEGMRRVSTAEEKRDEVFNRRATLLKSISTVLICSPVCEKQALFALFQSHKENVIEERTIKKVLGSVARTLGYKSPESLVGSHLDYLVTEWLRQRQTNPDYTLQSFPFSLLNHATLEDFYRSSYHVLVPHLVFLDDFEQVKSIGAQLKMDWKQLLADCFPKIMVNILPYFAFSGSDSQVTLQRDTAHRVYDLLKDASCLGKQQIDSLIHSNLADIVVELLMTLYEGTEQGAGDEGELQRFIGELDPAPNPPYFNSYVIKATLDYLSKCHSSNLKSLVAILSKTPVSIQKVLFAICRRATETTNAYEKHRVLLMYHLFVSLLLKEVKDGLGGAWAFVLRDIIYTLIHHINSRPAQLDEVSARSFTLCCDLLTSVCRTAVQFCGDALESHLQVIVGTLTAQVIDHSVFSLLTFLVVDNQDYEHLKQAVRRLEPFPDQPAFQKLRTMQHTLKYRKGTFTLRQEIDHFLAVSSCDALPMTRLEGLKDLKRQLRAHKGQIKNLLWECQAHPAESVLVRLVLNLLQLCKLAANDPGGRDVLEAAGSCLGELGPLDLSTTALLRGRDHVHSQAVELFSDIEHQWIFIIFNCINNALIHPSIQVKQAAVQCLTAILATRCGAEFWESHKNNNDPMLVYFNPFRSARKKPLEVSARPRTQDLLDSSELWVSQNGQLNTWLTSLCVALLDSGGVTNEALLLSRPLCEVQTDFCQKVLPLLIHNILLHDPDGSWRDLLSGHIRDFFTSCSRAAFASSRSTTPLLTDSGELPSRDPPGVLNRGSLDRASLRTMLSVIDYLRQQKRPLDTSCGTVCHSNFWLELNYLEVARAAQWCSAHFTALLYSEIYVDKIRCSTEDDDRWSSRARFLNRTKILFEESSQNFTITSLSERGIEDSGISLQDLLIEVYRSIGEPDSLYGCGGGKMVNPLTRIRTYEHEAQWGKALTSYDLHSNLPEVTRQVGILEALQNFGLCSILETYLRGLESEGADWGAELWEKRFQAAWRNGQWDCDLNEKVDPGFNESIFSALQALRDKEFSAFDQILKYARVSEVEELCRGSLEAVSSLYPALCNLQRISELESVGNLCSRNVTDDGLDELFSGWQQHTQLLTDSDFSLLEPILALRTVAQGILIGQEQNTDRKEYLHTALASHLMELCKLARTAGNTQLAERTVCQIKQHGRGEHGAGTSPWQLEEAQVFWVRKEQSLALVILRQMIDKLSNQVSTGDPVSAVLLAECLRLCGNWLAETCLESPGVILEKYLEKAVEVIEDHKSGTNSLLQSQKTQAFLSLARFSDAQYQSIENYMKSSEFENKQALLQKAKDEVDLMAERKVNPNRYTVKVQRELELDERALANLQADRLRFLWKAVENYIWCLELGEEHDTWVFRLASLWLENSDVKDINDKMKVSSQSKIPSYKFIPLMYQLAARMGTKMSGAAVDTGFHDVLNELICRSSHDHPHHTLFIILALVNANKDETFSSSRLRKSTPRQPSQLDKERSEVASKIINVIRKEKAELVRGIELLCNAYITLAYMDASPIPIPSDQPITKIKDLDDVVIPTMDIKVDPSGKYDNLVTIKSFKPHFHLAGGVNLPKIIDCVGSDGKSRRQLVKGQDDLRQDAVMQQVFQMCSMLLQRNAETRKRKLNIRQYKVVPFSQRSGVLEWCSGTVPIGEFLVNPHKGAHHRFRPNDWSNLDCRKKMMQGFDGKMRAFSEVCQNFCPVFRYFLMERFLDPAVWLEKRLAYTRSVATSSIVGYIVGLGDRHIQNILIDEETAELVHIDLGVAFEQGKILPTPETVPFRLSRDIVDGMGITGVEGVFRRCCEKTMEVMRNSQEALLTIVEVLLYDPLFDWTMNPLKAFYLQQQHEEQAELNATLNPTLGGEELEAPRKSSDTQSFNKVAERVLLRLQEKLKGVEEGTVLSVGGQVNLLIQQAMDPKNLSRLFPGWQAWV
uniref:non-specific serine/threonine protein kinase n=1 Tax=Scleropages formosus TaxID=113540 RepID=A0A8C9SLP0_SCLFO